MRLHQLVLFGAAIGFISLLIDPFVQKDFSNTGVIKLIAAFVLSIFFLFAPDVIGWYETHPLIGPSWLLLLEYIANIFYAFFGRKLSNTSLLIIFIISAIALTATAVWRGNLGTGWAYDTFWIAFVRMMFPFSSGLLLFRLEKK